MKPGISLENTLTCPEAWLKCSVCGEEYSRLVGGVCPPCQSVSELEMARNETEKERIIEMMGQKGYEQFTFDKFKTSQENAMAFDKCRSFDPSKSSLYLWGSAGSGKTHLAGAIVRGVKGGVMLKSTSLVRWFRLRDPRDEEREIERLASVQVLVVDDLGVQKDSEHALSVLYEIIDRRDMNLRHGLVITSNLSLDVMAKKMGDDRIVSRIAGLCDVVEIKGKDMRVSR